MKFVLWVMGGLVFVVVLVADFYFGRATEEQRSPSPWSFVLGAVALLPILAGILFVSLQVGKLEMLFEARNEEIDLHIEDGIVRRKDEDKKRDEQYNSLINAIAAISRGVTQAIDDALPRAGVTPLASRSDPRGGREGGSTP